MKPMKAILTSRPDRRLSLDDIETEVTILSFVGSDGDVFAVVADPDGEVRSIPVPSPRHSLRLKET